MRDRHTGDWVVDLDARHDIEGEVEAGLAAHPRLTLLRASTNSYDRLDFQLEGPGERLVELEVKAKRQPLSEGWQSLRPDVAPEDLFVLDELALRKIVDGGRYAFLLVRDVPGRRWVLWSSGDLLVAGRARHARRIVKGSTPTVKGKLLFDLRDAGFRSPHLTPALDALASMIVVMDKLWTAVTPWPRTTAG